MSDTLDPIRRRLIDVTRTRDFRKRWAARLTFNAYAERDIATLLAEVDRLRETLATERAAWVDMREDVLQGGWTRGYPIEINDVLDKIDQYIPDGCFTPVTTEATP